MPYLDCTKNTAQQAAIAAAQAVQDTRLTALETGGGVTPAAVASAVDSMTPAQLAAMCAKLNCQPTAAALTAALLGLSGSGTAGNVLTIVGGAPAWQAPVAGNAASVPATGITAGVIGAGVTIPAAQVTGLAAAIGNAVDGSETKVAAGTNITVTGSGTTAAPYVVNATGGGAATTVPAAGVGAGALPAGVTTTPASVIGFNAAALAAVPDAADTIKGISALNLGTAAGDATNATDALTAAGLAAILNGAAPNTSPNALQAAVASNPSQYGTFASVLAPTAAPTAANPATRITNTNGEVFDWTGTKWILAGDGLSLAAVSGSGAVGTVMTVIASVTATRTGRVSVSSLAAVNSLAVTDVMFSAITVNGGTFAVYSNNTGHGSGLNNYQNNAISDLAVTVGDSIQLSIVYGATTNTTTGRIDVKYIG